MSFIVEERLSDAPCVAMLMHGYTAGDGSVIRPAENHWHMVFAQFNGKIQTLLVGPLTSSGVVSFSAGAEILWVKFKLGVFMPHLPTRQFLNREIPLPSATNGSFWLHSATWQAPNFENADTFINRLVCEGMLTYDPLVNVVLQGETQAYAERTLRHRFLRATGLTQNHIQQVERAHRAKLLLQQGVSILDATYQLGYYDQPHLTRSLKQWIGHRPTQLLCTSQAT
jgi:hypothetical protein